MWICYTLYISENLADHEIVCKCGIIPVVKGIESCVKVQVMRGSRNFHRGAEDGGGGVLTTPTYFTQRVVYKLCFFAVVFL